MSQFDQVPTFPGGIKIPFTQTTEDTDIQEVFKLLDKVVYNTTIETKRKYYDVFSQLIRGQFDHGGDKYKLPGFDDREATDVISAVFGGETQLDWILGTIVKYVFRFKNFRREKDLLKIATYCFIAWLKMGAHLKQEHDTDTEKK